MIWECWACGFVSCLFFRCRLTNLAKVESSDNLSEGLKQRGQHAQILTGYNFPWWTSNNHNHQNLSISGRMWENHYPTHSSWPRQCFWLQPPQLSSTELERTPPSALRILILVRICSKRSPERHHINPLPHLIWDFDKARIRTLYCFPAVRVSAPASSTCGPNFFFLIRDFSSWELGWILPSPLMSQQNLKYNAFLSCSIVTYQPKASIYCLSEVLVSFRARLIWPRMVREAPRQPDSQALPPTNH